MKKLLLGLLACAAFAPPLTIHANEANTYTIRKADAGGQEVKQNVGYFDLSMKPGEKRTIMAEVTNNYNEPITVENKILTSHTNENGELDHTTRPATYDETLKVKLHEIASVPLNDNKVKLAPKSNKLVKAEIEVPKSFKEGVLLGSWFFDNLSQDKEAKEKQKGTSVRSRYTMSLGIKITVNKEIAKPNVNLQDITVGLKNYHKAIFAQIQNDRPAIIGEVKYEGLVCKRGKFDAVFKGEQEGSQLAPNSNYKFPILLGEDQLEPGDYTYRIKVTSTDPKWEKKVWEFSKDFTVMADKAEKLNKEALNDPKPENDIPWLFIGIIIGLLLVIFGLLFFIWKRRKKDEEENKETIQK